MMRKTKYFVNKEAGEKLHLLLVVFSTFQGFIECHV